jgi:hypothetical protein
VVTFFPALGDDPSVDALAAGGDPPTQRPFPGWIITAGALVMLILVGVRTGGDQFVLWPRYREQGAHGQSNST